MYAYFFVCLFRRLHRVAISIVLSVNMLMLSLFTIWEEWWGCVVDKLLLSYVTHLATL